MESNTSRVSSSTFPLQTVEGDSLYHEFPTADVFFPLLPPRRFKGACGGRGSGKSQFFADLLIESCMNRPVRAVCIREVQLSLAQSSKLLIADKIRARGLHDRFLIQDKLIVAPHGGMIAFQGMQNHTADSIRSLEGFDIAWTDEAHKLSAYSLGLLRPTLRKPGSELWFSWNPQHPTDPVDALFRGKHPPPDSVCIETCYDDNPWFEETTLVEEMLYDRRRDPDRYRHVWLGEYMAHSEARVFRNWRVERFETPSSIDEWEHMKLRKRFYYGCDWGFATSPTVLVRCWISGRTLFVDHEAWDVGCEIDRTPDLFMRVPEADRWPITADSANPQAISYMRRHGFAKIEPSIKGKASVEEGVEFLKSYDIVVHPRCEHVIDELTSYSYEVDERTERVLPVLADRKNHTIDALRYALEGVRRAGQGAGMGYW